MDLPTLLNLIKPYVLGWIREAIQLDSAIYGTLYGDDVARSVTIASAGVYYEVGGGLRGGACNGLKVQAGKEVLITMAGTYLVNWSMTAQCASANQYVEGAIMVNTAAREDTVSAAELPSANKKVSLGGTGLLALSVNDVVKLCVENETGTNAVVVDHANLSLVRVGR